MATRRNSSWTPRVQGQGLWRVTSLCLVLCLTSPRDQVEVFAVSVTVAASPCMTSDFAGEADPGSKTGGVQSESFPENDRGYLMLDSDYAFQCCGVVREWQLRPAQEGTVELQVWRPVNGATYRLVGENVFTESGATALQLTQMAVPLSQRVSVRPNDVIGWRSVGQDVVDFGAGPGENANNILVSNMNDVTEGDMFPFPTTTTTGRSYGVRALLQPGSPPTFWNLPSPVTISRATGVGAILFTVNVSDSDSLDSHAFTATGLSPHFLIDPATGEISVNGVLPVTSLDIEVTAHDPCGYTVTGVLSVNIVNLAPVIISLPASVQVHENSVQTTLIHTVGVLDPEGDVINCSIASTSPVTSVFYITDKDVYLQSEPGLSYAASSGYTLTVQCSDGQAFDSEQLTVTLTPNQPPSLLNLPATTDVSVKTAQVNDVIYVVNASDVDSPSLSFNASNCACPFELLADGAVLVSSDLRGETTASYQMAVYVSDVRSVEGPAILTLRLTDLNVAPVLGNLPASLPVSETHTGAIFNVSVLDPDPGDPRIFFATWLPPEGVNYFRFDSSTGQVSVLTTLDLEAMAVTTYVIRLAVSDGIVTSPSADVTITVTDVNEAPAFSQNSFALSAVEGPAGTVLHDIGLQNAVTDPENATLTFHVIGGVLSNMFSIDVTTAILSLAADYEVDSSQLPATAEVVVAARDPGGLSSTATVTVTFADLNKAPSIVNLPRNVTISEDAAPGTTVFVLDPRDEDSGDIVTSHYVIIEGSVASAFDISTAGEVRVKAGASLDFETERRYVIEFRADDGSNTSLPGQLTIHVADVNEAPRFSSTTHYVSVDEGLKGTQLPDPGLSSDVIDPESSALTFAIVSGNHSNMFAINVTSGLLQFAEDFEVDAAAMPGHVTLEVSATDTGGLCATATVVITVRDVNKVPAISNLPRDVTVSEDATAGSAVFTVSASDADSGDVVTLRYVITAGDVASAFNIDVNSGDVSLKPTAILDFEAVSQYRLQFRADDGTNTSLPAELTINVADVNEPPVFSQTYFSLSGPEAAAGHALPDVGVAAAASDPEGQPLTFRLRPGNYSHLYVIDAGTAILSYAAHADSLPSLAQLQIEAVDAGGLIADVTVDVAITRLNKVPTLTNLPRSVSVAENLSPGSPVFKVEYSDLDLDDVITVRHAVVAGNAAGVFDIDSQGNVHLKSSASLDFETGSQYQIRFEADDGKNVSTSAMLTVDVTDENEAPYFSRASFSVTADEGVEGVPLPDAGLATDVTDPEHSALTFGIKGGNHSGMFNINASTAIFSFAADYEVDAAGMPGVVELEVSATDTGGLSATATVVITVRDVNKVPAISNLPRDVTMSEDSAPGSTVIDLDLRDPDTGQGVTLQYVVVVGDAGSVLDIHTQTGVISLKTSAHFDHERTPYYVIQCQADDGIATSLPANLTLYISDVNEPPMFSTSVFSVTVDEGPAGTVVLGGDLASAVSDPDLGDLVTFTLATGTHSDKFKVNSTSGQLTFAVNYDTDPARLPASVNLVVMATDSGGMSASATVHVTISNVNQAPSFSALPASLSVSEASPPGSPLLRLTLGDPDSADVITVRMTNVTSATSKFDLDSATHSLLLRPNSSLDYEMTSSYEVHFEADDGSGGCAVATLRIDVTDEDEAPVFSVHAFTVRTTSGHAGKVLPDPGLLSHVTDPEGGALSFRLVANGDSRNYVINTTSGVLSFARDVMIPSANSPLLHFLDIEVVDPGSQSSRTTVEVTVEHLNFAPVLSNLPRNLSVLETATPGDLVMRVMATDDNAEDSLVFRHHFLSGAGDSYFLFNDSNGEVRVRTGSTLDAGTTPEFVAEVWADDGMVTSAPQLLVISVTDVNRAPVFLYRTFHLSVLEGATGTVVPGSPVSFQDPDVGDVHSFSVSQGSGSGVIGINSSTGQLSFMLPYDLDLPGTASVLDLAVEVTDSRGLSDVTTVIVTVLDLNDNSPIPAVDPVTFFISSDVTVGTVLGNVNVTDADSGVNADVTYAVFNSSVTSQFFDVTHDGEVYVKSLLTDDVDAGSTITLTLTATDHGSPSRSCAVAVRVVVETEAAAPANAQTSSLPFLQQPENVGLFSLGVLGLLALAAAGAVLVAVLCCKQPGRRCRSKNQPDRAKEKFWGDDLADEGKDRKRSGEGSRPQPRPRPPSPEQRSADPSPLPPATGPTPPGWPGTPPPKPSPSGTPVNDDLLGSPLSRSLSQSLSHSPPSYASSLDSRQASSTGVPNRSTSRHDRHLAGHVTTPTDVEVIATPGSRSFEYSHVML